MSVDVCWEGLLPLDLWVGNPTVLQSEALQLPWLTGQLPVHLHGCLVQDLSEETGRTGNYETDRDTWSDHMVNICETSRKNLNFITTMLFFGVF